MTTSRRQWNKQQKEFRQILLNLKEHEKAIECFRVQHGVLHSAAVDGSLGWSFEDELFTDLPDELVRRIPTNCEHSIAWNIWHIARIEDVTMNILVAGTPQLYVQTGWFERLGIEARHTGNSMSETAVRELSEAIDIEQLRSYRTAVGRRTREIVGQISSEDLQAKIDPSRLQQVLDVGAVVEEAIGLIEYWGKRDIAGLLLMPATRHNFVHLNEAERLKRRRK
jgi:hypothetical protein